VTVYQYSTTYATAHRVTDSGEHRSKYHVRATEDDILSEIRRKDRIAISEMKGAFLRRNYTPPENGQRKAELSFSVAAGSI